MARFCKRPVTIEAVQYHLREYADNPLVFDEVPDWLLEAIKTGVVKPVFKTEDYWYLEIKTLDSVAVAGPGDWIIRGVRGELYPCKDDIFKETYHPV